jgi:hypothetical protein
MSRIKSIINRADWLQHITTWRASELTQAAYCRQHKLNATTFNGWINRGRKTLSSRTQLTTVPVVIQTDAPATSALSPIVLHHGTGWQLALPADVQITWLARLLNELA